MLGIQIVKEGVTAQGATRQRGTEWLHGVDILGADDDGDGFRLHLTVGEAELLVDLAIANRDAMLAKEPAPAP